MDEFSEANYLSMMKSLSQKSILLRLAHDLQNRSNGIAGATGLIKHLRNSNPDDKQIEQLLDSISSCAEDIMNMAGAMLDYDKEATKLS